MQRSTTITRTFHPVLILLFLMALTSSGSSGRTYAMPQTTMTGYIWDDTNCDGIRQEGEPLHMGTTVYLFAAGEDNVINTADDQVIAQAGQAGVLWFNLGTTGLDYALAVLPRDRPAGIYPGPLNAGDNRSIDNDMRADLWVTNGFQMSETETVTGIDIGLCQVQLTPRLYLPAIWR